MLFRYEPTLMSYFLDNHPGAEAPEADWAPRCDILERDNEYVIHLEAPGIEKEDARVEYRNNLLTISGQKKRPAQNESERCYRTERRYGTFSRVFRLGEEIAADKIKASYEDGILTIVLPKTEKVLPKRIEVKVA